MNINIIKDLIVGQYRDVRDKLVNQLFEIASDVGRADDHRLIIRGCAFLQGFGQIFYDFLGHIGFQFNDTQKS